MVETIDGDDKTEDNGFLVEVNRSNWRALYGQGVRLVDNKTSGLGDKDHRHRDDLLIDWRELFHLAA